MPAIMVRCVALCLNFHFLIEQFFVNKHMQRDHPAM